MSDLSDRTIRRLGEQLRGRLSMPGDERYAAATAIWAKPVGRMPRAIAHCRTLEDVQSAIRAARDGDLPLSVRGGGHDWAGRALCDGLVIDMSAMNSVAVGADNRTAHIGGGARASDVLAVTNSRQLAAAMGSVGAVGLAGLTLGGGYGPLIGRFGLALDNLLAVEIVLADGRIVTARQDREEDLFWALRGGGGNFGVVTAMQHRLHHLPSVQAGVLFYPFAEAKAIWERCTDIAASEPEDLTIQLGFVTGPDGKPLVFVAPIWCGLPAKGEARIAPLLKLGTLLMGTVEEKSYGSALAAFDGYFVDGQRAFIETSRLPALDGNSIDALIHAMEKAVSPGCAIVTHEFKGAATRVPVEATAFGLRRDHILIEIIATWPDEMGELAAERHQQWVRATCQALDTMAFPGAYANMLAEDDAQRVAASYGPNAARLIEVKRQYDPDNVFRSAIPLPISQNNSRPLRSARP
jgi:FAD/FMN-containing dehydrogenase